MHDIVRSVRHGLCCILGMALLFYENESTVLNNEVGDGMVQYDGCFVTLAAPISHSRQCHNAPSAPRAIS